MNLKELNDNIQASFVRSHYQVYLLNNGFTDSYTEQIKHDNIIFEKDGIIVYSIRIDLESKQYQHLDFYSKKAARPYKRVFLNEKGDVVLERYYELETWQRNYDVYLDNQFQPFYTIEYFSDNKQRYIDWQFEPGKLYYQQKEFLDTVAKAM